MATKPADRYRSCLELSADIERYLADEPVTAYEEPLSISEVNGYLMGQDSA